MPRSIHIIQTVIPEYRLDFFKGIVNGLSDFKIYFYCSSEQKHSPQTSINVGSLNPRYFKTLSLKNWIVVFKISFLKYFKRGDIVVLEGNPRTLNNYWILFFSYFIGYKVVWWSIYLMPYSKTRWFREQLMRYVTWNLLYTEREYEVFSSRYPKSKNISYLNNTVSVEHHSLDDLTDHEMFVFDRVRTFLNDSVKNLIYVGRLTPKPRLEIVLEFLKRNSDYYFVIVGDGELKGEVCRLIEKFHLQNRVHMTGSIYNKSLLMKIMGLSQLFVYPGSIGLSVFTAFSAGLPVITHDNENFQAPEFYAVKNGFNSITYEYGNRSDFELKIKSFFSMDNHNLGKNAFLTINEDYSMDKMIKNFIATINQL